jgi:hypothetical protein
MKPRLVAGRMVRYGIPHFKTRREFSSWFARFIVGASLVTSLGIAFLTLTSYPIDLLLIMFRLYPQPFLVFALFILLSIWFYRRLGSPAIQGLIPAALTFAILAAVFLWMPHSDVAKALELARLQVGAGYRFHVNGMAWSSAKGAKATVLAYNENEIRAVRVAW